MRALRFIDEHEEISGPVNVSSLGVSESRSLGVSESRSLGVAHDTALMAALRRAVRMPFGIPAPRWVLEIGMLILQQEFELVLKSRWVLPGRLEQAGF